MSGGLFITLADEETLDLYLSKGVYGFHMSPIEGSVPKNSRHYAALADYACTRAGMSVFFFIKRKIVYAGEIVGSSGYGAFYLNGPYSPMGREQKSKIYWDESTRSIYRSIAEKPGTFLRKNDEEQKPVCQPYIVRFEDRIGLKGAYIRSDQLYFELGEYSYPLPTNSISGMGFCTMTPGETNAAIRLVTDEPIATIKATLQKSQPNITGFPMAFQPKMGINSLDDAITEHHLEASILANLKLLPKALQLGTSTICRQIPISPFKPKDMDRADICIFDEDDPIRNGTVPNVVVELKNEKAGKAAIDQVERYARWLSKRLGNDEKGIEYYLLAPDFAKGAGPSKMASDRIHLMKFDGTDL